MIPLQVNLFDTDRAIVNSLEVIYIPVDASIKPQANEKSLDEFLSAKIQTDE